MRYWLSKMQRTKNIKRATESGQALIETALVLPLLVFLLLGIIELGRYAGIAIEVANAARAGAVYGAQNLPDSANWQAIQRAAQNDSGLGSNLSVISSIGLLPSDSLNPCHEIADTESPLPYVVVRTTYVGTPLFFSSLAMVLTGCAQMQVAE